MSLGQLWAAAVESLLCCFGTSCHCGQSLDELFSLCDPIRRHTGKGERRDALQSKKVLHPVFCFSRVATVQLRVWMRGFLCVCFRLWHCEVVVCVFLMFCSAKAGWYHQALERSGVGGVGGLHSYKRIKSGIELEALLTVWMAEVARGATGKLSSSFGCLFCRSG